MSSEDYKAVTVRLYATIAEVFQTGNIALLDPLLAPDMVDHTVPNGPVVGREPGKQLIATYAHAFPDTSLTVDLMVVEADTVAAFVSYHGTHTGPFMGYPPSGKSVPGWPELVRTSEPGPSTTTAPDEPGRYASSAVGVLTLPP